MTYDLDAKLRTGYSDAKTALSWRKYKLGKAFVEKLCDELYEWGKKGTSTDFLQFYHSWGIPKRTFHDYMKKHPDLKFIYDIVKVILGWRRQELATYKKYKCNPSIICQTLRFYHPDWKAVYEEDKDLKKELKQDDTKQKPTNFTVVMQDYEDTEGQEY